MIMKPQFGRAHERETPRKGKKMSTIHQDLEARLRIIEDKLAIYDLLASHPPSADTGSADYTVLAYRENGVFDRGPALDGAQGSEAIAAFIQRPEHHAAIRSGLAHFVGLPLVDLKGDTAIATSYLMITHLDHEGVPRELPNHGVSTGYRIHRAVVNRWELERRDGRWVIARRTLLPVDGSDPQLALLRQNLCEMYGLRFDESNPLGGGER